MRPIGVHNVDRGKVRGGFLVSQLGCPASWLRESGEEDAFEESISTN